MGTTQAVSALNHEEEELLHIRHLKVTNFRDVAYLQQKPESVERASDAPSPLRRNAIERYAKVAGEVDYIVTLVLNEFFEGKWS